MATNVDSFPITAAMLAYAWVKPPTVFNTGVGETNCSNDYTPRTLKERAGARGGPNAAVSTDPNWTFAISAEGPAVECDATLVLPPDPT
jgi:hypothetical protein